MVAPEPASIGVQPPLTHPLSWRLQRVSFADRQPARILQFQPGLNIVLCSLGSVDAVLGRLGKVLHAGDGTHVEFAINDGASFVLFRPFAARHRLVEVENCQERPLGELESFRFNPECTDAATRRTDADTVYHLSGLDQGVLWRLADQLAADRAAVLTQPGGESGGGPTGGEGRLSRPGAFRRLLRRKPRSTNASVPCGRPGESTTTGTTWMQLVGPIDVDAALCQRDRVAAAVGLAGRIGAMATVGAPDVRGEWSVDPIEIVRTVCALMPRSHPDGGPCVVAVSPSLDHELLSFVLDHLAGRSDGRQIIVVTEDESVADWAHLESHARRTALLGFDQAAEAKLMPGSV